MYKLSRAVVPAILSFGIFAAQPATAVVPITGDPVLYWNQLALSTLTPTAAIRTYAMMNIAMHDSLNASLGYSRVPYLTGVANPGGNGSVAAIQAAHDILVNANPAAAAQYATALTASLAQYADGGAKANGIVTGQAFAAAMIANRANDGAFTPVTYTPSGLPGRYAPTPPGFQPPITPQWANVMPFFLSSSDQFRASPPPALNSQAYADAFAEVKELGSATSSTRTVDQTAAAQFWSTANGATYMQLALAAAEDEGLSTFDNARLFALLGTGIADTLISLWNTKYTYDFWRPVTAIQNADLDGNPLTTADPAWRSLIAAPPHPSYVSAHSGLGAAVTGILVDVIGEESFCATLGPNTRCWSSLNEMAVDGATSRIYGGIHFRFDSEAGLALGSQVAQWQRSRGLFRAVPEPTSWASMIAGTALMGIWLRRRRPGKAGRVSPPGIGADALLPA